MPRARFSLTGSTGLGWPQFVEAATTAEQLGFYGFYPSDHLYLPGRAPSDDYMDALTGIAALAPLTSTLRLGVMVAGNVFRHPVMLTKIATTIDHASSGRMELGIGAAWDEAECLIYGIPFPPPKERVARLRDAARVIKGLWTNDATTLDSPYYPLKAAPLFPKPIQRPHPPLIVGGGGNSTLRTAAEFADEWNYIGPFSSAGERNERLNTLCAEYGRDPTDIRRSVVLNLHLTSSAAEAESVIEEVAVRMRTIGNASSDLLGLPNDRLARETTLIGGPTEVAEQIERWVGLGIDHLAFFTPRPFDRPMLDRFATEVMPLFA